MGESRQVAIDIEGIQESWFRRLIYTGRYFVSAISLLAFAYSLWNIDNNRWICFPDSLFQVKKKKKEV